MNSNLRQRENREIVKIISKIVEMFPDWRFHQILQNIDCSICLTDQWHEEPWETTTRMKANTLVKGALKHEDNSQ